MTTTDSIVFIKETQTCHYVLHIATPRLCGEPGFRNRLDAREEAYIRCREILSAEAYETADRSLPPADHPFKMPKRTKPPVISPPPPKEQDGKNEAAGGITASGKLSQLLEGKPEFLRKAMEKLMAAGGGLANGATVMMDAFDEDGEDGEEVVFEFLVDELDLEELLDFGGSDEEGKTKKKDGEKPKGAGELLEMLRAQQQVLKDLRGKLDTQSQGKKGQEKKKNEKKGSS